MTRDEPRCMWVCEHGYVTDEDLTYNGTRIEDGFVRPRIDTPCQPQESTMTDTPASSAADATSSPASPETASDETLPELDFTFRRGDAQKFVIAGTTPYIVLLQNDKGLSIVGGGLPAETPDVVIGEFLLAAADVFHDMGIQVMERAKA